MNQVSLEFEFRLPATPVCLVLLLHWGINVCEDVVATDGMVFMLIVCLNKETGTV